MHVHGNRQSVSINYAFEIASRIFSLFPWMERTNQPTLLKAINHNVEHSFGNIFYTLKCQFDKKRQQHRQSRIINNKSNAVCTHKLAGDTLVEYQIQSLGITYSIYSIHRYMNQFPLNIVDSIFE